MLATVALLILLVITISVLAGGHAASKSAADPRPPAASQPVAAPATSPTHHATSRRHHRTSGSPTQHRATGTQPVSPSPTTTDPATSQTTTGQPATAAPTSAAPQPCDVTHLDLSAATDKTQYGIHDNPVLSLLVTNPGPQPCAQDLGDPQIVLSVYNGVARVWGSHDCKIEPGTDERTLMPHSTVRVIIQWTGLSSSPHCAGTRQRVGAGSYTLYAALAGHEAKSSQFTIG